MDTVKSFITSDDLALKEFLKNLLNDPKIDIKSLHNTLDSSNFPKSKEILSSITDPKEGLLSLIENNDAFNESKPELQKFVNENIDNLSIAKTFVETLQNSDEVRTKFEE